MGCDILWFTTERWSLRNGAAHEPLCRSRRPYLEPSSVSASLQVPDAGQNDQALQRQSLFIIHRAKRAIYSVN